MIPKLSYLRLRGFLATNRRAFTLRKTGGTLYSLNRLTGGKRWDYRTSGPIYRVAALASDGTVYQGINDGNFYAISSAGAKVWSIVLDGLVTGLPSVDANNNIYVGTQGGSLYAISSDGIIRWKQTVGGDVFGGALIANSTVYVGSTQGLTAIEADLSATATPTLPVTTTTPTPVTSTPAPSTATPTPPVINQDQCTVSIEGGKAFTNRRTVSVKSNMASAVEMQLSNDGGFGGAVWQPYQPNLVWTLNDPGNRIATLLVYARFRNASGLLCNSAAMIDDIVYDPLPPKVTVSLVQLDQTSMSLMHRQSHSVTLRITATDQPGGSDIDVMQVATKPDFTDAVWEPFVTEKTVSLPSNTSNPTLYVRVRDGAENDSDTAVVSTSKRTAVFLPITLR